VREKRDKGFAGSSHYFSGNTATANTLKTRYVTFGLGKNQMGDVVLIPGLKVDIDGTPDHGGRFVAKTITVDGDDLEVPTGN
jgi:hypothetical protein